MRTLSSALLVCSLIFYSCSSKQTTSLTPSPGKGIVVYKANFIYEGRKNKRISALFFNEEMIGVANVPQNGNKLMMISLPKGKNNISKISYNIGGIKGIVEKELNKDKTSFLVNSETVTYLGDLNFNWVGVDESVGVGEFVGGIFVLLSGSDENGKVNVTVENKINEIQTFLENKYNRTVEVTFSPPGSI